LALVSGEALFEAIMLTQCLDWVSGKSACAVLVMVVGLLAFAGEARAQDGKYILDASTRVGQLVDEAGQTGYRLPSDAVALGGGWLRKSEQTWITLYSVTLEKGQEYLFVGAGDADTRNLDLQVLGTGGQVVAQDAATDAVCKVPYGCNESGRYTVRMRLFASEKDFPCFCLGVTLAKSNNAAVKGGKFIVEAAKRLSRLVDDGRKAGYKLPLNGLALVGGWLRQGENNWVDFYNVSVDEGKTYRFLAAGDDDAIDLDLRVLSGNGRVVAEDVALEPEAAVQHRAAATERCPMRLRLYASDRNHPCVCLAVVMAK
jgi:hypothetical protein